jgi:AcrR family transcriptional regulator
MEPGMSRKKQKNKGLWLETGIEILSAEGPQSLTIDNLVNRIGKTKGAFYHHFNSYGNYAKKLLEHWMSIYTTDIIEKSRNCRSPNEKLKTLLMLTLKIPRKTELAIRSWALYNPIVREYQLKIDQDRLEYLKELYFSMFKDIKKAELKAFRIYSAFIGYQQIANQIAGNKSPYITELFEVANYEAGN